MKKSMWARLIAVIGLICVCACMAGCGAGSGRITKDEFRDKLKQNKIYEKVLYMDKTKFMTIMGKPDNTSVVGNDAFWHYTCKDGTIQLVLNQANLKLDGGVWIEMINEL